MTPPTPMIPQTMGNITVFAILGLSISILIGIYYLIFNEHLWLTAASHAYVLIGFVIADFIFLFFLLGNRSRRGLIGALAVSIIEAAAMILDVFSYQSIPFFKVLGSDFKDMFEHTYGTWSFDLLLASQFWIIGTSLIALKKASETKPTKKQIRIIPAVLTGTAILLFVFPIAPIYEKQDWVYVHGVGWQAPESFRNKDIKLADQFLSINGTMVLKQTHPLNVFGTVSMKVPCKEDGYSLLTIYAGTRINLHELETEYRAVDSQPPFFCVYNAGFPQGDYIVNFVGIENSSNEPIFFSSDHSISLRITRIEGEVPVHFGQGEEAP